ncbi:efflux RND transporter periplasmic adaptor subunit [Aestuariivirga sp.]|uniref:efflux RND transporter periplasmic adaptor subunit n=1 Tax=Aestuariivirga sp. TaxID=2650926 RepID=UPI0039193641
MRTWIFLLTSVAIAAAAAFGIRHYGIDVAALTGLGEAITPGPPAQRQVAERGNRGPSPVETARAQPSRLSDDISAIGTLLSQESVAIAPETSGRVAKILFEDGSRVEAGTPLFQFDDDLARSDLEEARARLKLAEANYARNQKLRKSGNVAESAYEEALSARDVARTAVESAEVRLAKLTIAAPFSGTLGFRSVSEGAYVTAGTALVQLDKVDRLKVSFSVPELQQQALQQARTVEVVADAVPGARFTAEISALNPAVDVNGRALQVRADLDNAAMKLRPGLLVRVSVKGPERQAVMVPESAIVQRGGKAVLYTVAEGKAKEISVRLGKRVEGRVEVVEGIAAGDVVVTAGNTRLSNGAEVEVVSAAAAAE